MSILIYGIDMPTYFPIPLKIFPDGRVGVSNSAGTLVMKDAEAVPIPQRGKWIRVRWYEDENDGSWIVRCSACGILHNKESQFCPDCGAKMQ